MSALGRLMLLNVLSVYFRVPTVPVKNLNGSSPVHPALAGKKIYSLDHTFMSKTCLSFSYYVLADVLE